MLTDPKFPSDLYRLHDGRVGSRGEAFRENLRYWHEQMAVAKAKMEQIRQDLATMDEQIDIDVRSKPGDIRWTCPVCQMTRTLTPEGVRIFRETYGHETLRCVKDQVEMVRTIVDASSSG